MSVTHILCSPPTTYTHTLTYTPTHTHTRVHIHTQTLDTYIPTHTHTHAHDTYTPTGVHTYTHKKHTDKCAHTHMAQWWPDRYPAPSPPPPRPLTPPTLSITAVFHLIPVPPLFHLIPLDNSHGLPFISRSINILVLKTPWNTEWSVLAVSSFGAMMRFNWTAVVRYEYEYPFKCLENVLLRPGHNVWLHMIHIRDSGQVDHNAPQWTTQPTVWLRVHPMNHNDSHEFQQCVYSKQRLWRQKRVVLELL